MLIESPYFVLRRFGVDLMGELVDRGVTVQVLTNSLASNDALPVHAGYAKTRERLLQHGVELYEFRADTEDFRAGWSFVAGGSRSALHAKALAFDQEAVFIGSYNLELIEPRAEDCSPLGKPSRHPAVANAAVHLTGHRGHGWACGTGSGNSKAASKSRSPRSPRLRCSARAMSA